MKRLTFFFSDDLFVDVVTFFAFTGAFAFVAFCFSKYDGTLFLGVALVTSFAFVFLPPTLNAPIPPSVTFLIPSTPPIPAVYHIMNTGALNLLVDEKVHKSNVTCIQYIIYT